MHPKLRLTLPRARCSGRNREPLCLPSEGQNNALRLRRTSGVKCSSVSGGFGGAACSRPMFWRNWDRRICLISTLHALLTMLEGPFEEHWEERATAVWALGLAHLSVRQGQTVSRVLCGVLRRKMLGRSAHKERWLDAPIVLVAIPWLLCWLFALTWRSSEGQGSPLLFQAGALTGSIYIGYRLNQSLKTIATLRANRLRVAAATALGRIACADSIAALARTALDGSRTVRLASEPALQACLAQLTPAHYGELDADVIPNLCHLLERAREQLHHNSASATELALSLLGALDKIGDGRAVAVTRNLINTGWTAPVNQAAKDLLPVLLARQQQETNQRILLRSASVPPEPTYALLRPITNPADDNQPQTLLRPLNGE